MKKLYTAVSLALSVAALASMFMYAAFDMQWWVTIPLGEPRSFFRAMLMFVFHMVALFQFVVVWDCALVE